MDEVIVFQPYQGTKAPSEEGFWESLGRNTDPAQDLNRNGIMYTQLCDKEGEDSFSKIFFYLNNKWYPLFDIADSEDYQELQTLIASIGENPHQQVPEGEDASGEAVGPVVPETLWGAVQQIILKYVTRSELKEKMNSLDARLTAVEQKLSALLES